MLDTDCEIKNYVIYSEETDIVKTIFNVLEGLEGYTYEKVIRGDKYLDTLHRDVYTTSTIVLFVDSNSFNEIDKEIRFINKKIIEEKSIAIALKVVFLFDCPVNSKLYDLCIKGSDNKTFNKKNASEEEYKKFFLDGSLPKETSDRNVAETKCDFSDKKHDTSDEKSTYGNPMYHDRKEKERLSTQRDIFKKFDKEIYDKLVNSMQGKLNVLDIGTGNGDQLFSRIDMDKINFFLGVDNNSIYIDDGKEKYKKFIDDGKIRFIEKDVTKGESFLEMLKNECKNYLPDNQERDGYFDIINFSMICLHIIKDLEDLLKQLKPFLKDGGKLIIIDIDDGLNFAYPDEGNVFEKVYEICANDRGSGFRTTGRRLYHYLYNSGFRNIKMEKTGFSTIDLSISEKRQMWNIYFEMIHDDLERIKEKQQYTEYGGNKEQLESDLESYDNNIGKMGDTFKYDLDFNFCLGLQIYTAEKSKD